MSIQLRHYSRFVMPCNSEYKALELSDEKPLAYDLTFWGYSGYYPLMICPYNCKFETGFMFPYVNRLEESCDDDLYQIVFDNRKNESTTLEQIKNAYEKFINDTKQIVDGINKEINKK